MKKNFLSKKLKRRFQNNHILLLVELKKLGSDVKRNLTKAIRKCFSKLLFFKKVLLTIPALLKMRARLKGQLKGW